MLFTNDLTISINEFEQVCVSGELSGYDYKLYCFSEAYQAWVEQNVPFLEKNYPSDHSKLIERIEKELLKLEIEQAERGAM